MKTTLTGYPQPDETPEERYRALRAAGVSAVETIPVLRREYGLDLRGAKEVIARGEGTTLDAAQAALLPALAAALRDGDPD